MAIIGGIPHFQTYPTGTVAGSDWKWLEVTGAVASHGPLGVSGGSWSAACRKVSIAACGGGGKKTAASSCHFAVLMTFKSRYPPNHHFFAEFFIINHPAIGVPPWQWIALKWGPSIPWSTCQLCLQSPAPRPPAVCLAGLLYHWQSNMALEHRSSPWSCICVCAHMCI